MVILLISANLWLPLIHYEVLFFLLSVASRIYFLHKMWGKLNDWDTIMYFLTSFITWKKHGIGMWRDAIQPSETILSKFVS